MVNKGKFSVLGIQINAVDYDFSIDQIIKAAKERRSMTISALASHGVMEGYADNEHLARLSTFDLILPDGQPVRHAMGFLYGVWLKDRVAGPHLTPKLLEACQRENLSVYFYGSTSETLEKMKAQFAKTYPALRISGCTPSKFQQISKVKQRSLAEEIERKKPDLLFVGLGCPRQEVWCYEHKDLIQCPMIAVGAAFDFGAGQLVRAPDWVQKFSLEWLFRLSREPKRLWRRYLILGSKYLFLLLVQRFNKLPERENVNEQEITYQGYA